MRKHFVNSSLIKGLSLGLLFLFASVTVYAQRYSYESIPNDPMQTRIYTLKNGLKIYLSVNKEKPRVQTYIAVRTGSRNDPKETTGLAHYLEHLMFKGTTHFGSSNVEAERPTSTLSRLVSSSIVVSLTQLLANSGTTRLTQSHNLRLVTTFQTSTTR